MCLKVNTKEQQIMRRFKIIFLSDETSIALTAIAATYPLKIKCYIKCVGEMGDFVNINIFLIIA